MKLKEEKGITLVALAITIAVMSILAGIATHAGLESVRSAKRTAFITELEMIQAKVNNIYEKRKTSNEEVEYYDSLGQDPSVADQSKLQLVLNGQSRAGFRYFTKQDLEKDLELSGISQDVIINYNTRQVISLTGVNIDGKMYYRLEDIPDYLMYNVKHEEVNRDAPTFNVKITKLNTGWKFEVVDIVYANNTQGGELSYKLHNSENWILLGNTTNFTTDEVGIYDIRLTDKMGHSTTVVKEWSDEFVTTDLYKDNNGNTATIPAGFQVSLEHSTIKDGLVIRNAEDLNEFVWIPVDNPSDYKRVAWKNDDITSHFTEKMPEDERTSIEAYHGYYIGRYEAGIEGYTNVNTDTSSNTDINFTGYSGENMKLVIQSGKQVWNYITRDRAKAESERLYNKAKDNVTSRLCSSYAWDTALSFIAKTYPEYPINSFQGNYKESTFSYTDLEGQTKNKAKGNAVLVPTGQTISIDNIYDMGGNIWEWTTDIYIVTDYPCTKRGGGYLRR